MKSKALEWFGVITAIMYSMMVALNIGEYWGRIYWLSFIASVSLFNWVLGIPRKA